MIVALPSKHEAIADALAAEGFNVVNVDAHIRQFLAELDPPIAAGVALANMGGGPQLSVKLDEMRRRVHAIGRHNRWEVDDRDGLRMTVTKHDRYGDRGVVEFDLLPTSPSVISSCAA